MWKVLIADDEPKIRKGLINSVNWNELGMEVVGEAEDGEIAFEMIQAHSPDILLLDICMPFMDGLELIGKAQELLKDSIIILVTGHDEFTYAQKALKLKVFDYILKPVSQDQLLSVIMKANDKLTELRAMNKYLTWASHQLEKNLPFFKESFLNDWVNNHLTEIEIQEQMKFLGLEFGERLGMFIVKVVERLSKSELMPEWDRQLLLFAMQNIVEELLQNYQPSLVFRDVKGNIVAISNIKQSVDCAALEKRISDTVERLLKQLVITSYERIDAGLMQVSQVYEKLIEELYEKGSCIPIVLLVKRYIEENYNKEDLSLQNLAEEAQISPNYLSRLLKQEIGVSFIDYLTRIRVQKAIQLMNNPKLKIYEVSEMVGYSSQHYFSRAFKRVLGVSPVEYRKGGSENA